MYADDLLISSFKKTKLSIKCIVPRLAATVTDISHIVRLPGFVCVCVCVCLVGSCNARLCQGSVKGGAGMKKRKSQKGKRDE